MLTLIGSSTRAAYGTARNAFLDSDENPHSMPADAGGVPEGGECRFRGGPEAAAENAARSLAYGQGGGTICGRTRINSEVRYIEFCRTLLRSAAKM